MLLWAFFLQCGVVYMLVQLMLHYFLLSLQNFVDESKFLLIMINFKEGKMASKI
jgi:hypothetical protein